MNPEHYLFVDERLLGTCAFCGGTPGTRDHVPSKILLDDAQAAFAIARRDHQRLSRGHPGRRDPLHQEIELLGKR
jgi:hypothetical protein